MDRTMQALRWIELRFALKVGKKIWVKWMVLEHISF